MNNKIRLFKTPPDNVSFSINYVRDRKKITTTTITSMSINSFVLIVKDRTLFMYTFTFLYLQVWEVIKILS